LREFIELILGHSFSIDEVLGNWSWFGSRFHLSKLLSNNWSSYWFRFSGSNKTVVFLVVLLSFLVLLVVLVVAHFFKVSFFESVRH